MNGIAKYFLGMATVALLVMTGCEGATTSFGKWKKSNITSEGGWIEGGIKSANGTIDETIELEKWDQRLRADVTLEIDRGACRIEMLDGQRNVTLSLEAIPGQTVSGGGPMESSFGKARYRLVAAKAKNVKYRIEIDVK